MSECFFGRRSSPRHCRADLPSLSLCVCVTCVDSTSSFQRTRRFRRGGSRAGEGARTTTSACSAFFGSTRPAEDDDDERYNPLIEDFTNTESAPMRMNLEVNRTHKHTCRVSNILKDI